METLALVRKLLRDVRLMLAGVALLLGAFQCLFAKISERVIAQLDIARWAGPPGRLQPARRAGQGLRGAGQGRPHTHGRQDAGTGQRHGRVVHRLRRIRWCWSSFASGPLAEAAGAIAGEIDRGTMELLLAQPLSRGRFMLAHFLVDVLTIPLLCLSMWAGNWLGAWWIGPVIQVEPLPIHPPRPVYLVELGPLKVRLQSPLDDGAKPAPSPSDSERLRVRPEAFGPALWVVGGFLFAASGITLALSAAGRYRGRVLGIAVFLFVVQFLVNLVGQMWPPAAPLRPFSLFYYYQPQQVIFGHDWTVNLREWNGGRPLCAVPIPVVLYGVGVVRLPAGGVDLPPPRFAGAAVTAQDPPRRLTRHGDRRRQRTTTATSTWRHRNRRRQGAPGTPAAPGRGRRRSLPARPAHASAGRPATAECTAAGAASNGPKAASCRRPRSGTRLAWPGPGRGSARASAVRGEGGP